MNNRKCDKTVILVFDFFVCLIVRFYCFFFVHSNNGNLIKSTVTPVWHTMSMFIVHVQWQVVFYPHFNSKGISFPCFHVCFFYSFCTSVVIYVLFNEIGHKINCNNEAFLDARRFHYNQHNIVRTFYVKNANIKTRFNGKYLHLLCDTRRQDKREKKHKCSIRHK